MIAREKDIAGSDIHILVGFEVCDRVFRVCVTSFVQGMA